MHKIKKTKLFFHTTAQKTTKIRKTHTSSHKVSPSLPLSHPLILPPTHTHTYTCAHTLFSTQNTCASSHTHTCMHTHTHAHTHMHTRHLTVTGGFGTPGKPSPTGTCVRTSHGETGIALVCHCGTKACITGTIEEEAIVDGLRHPTVDHCMKKI